jgi:AcrR family transcriptional regulator
MGETSEDKREQILKSASIFFGKYGFSKTTLDDIAGYMGMKKNSLYYYFPSKEALFEEVTKEKILRIFKKINDAVLLKETAADKLRTCFEAGNRVVKEENTPEFSVQSIIDIQNTIKNFYSDYTKKSISMLEKIISDGTDSGEFKKCKPAEIAKAIINLVESIKLRQFYESKAKYLSEIDFTESEKTISTLLNLIIDGLKVK